MVRAIAYRLLPGVIVGALAMGSPVASVPAQEKPHTAAQGQDAAALIKAGREALAAGQAHEAAGLADRALALAPRNREAVGLKIQAAIAQGKPQEALRAYDALVASLAKQDMQLLGVLSTGLLEQAARAASPNPELGIEALYRLARSGNATARQELERRMSLGGNDAQALPLLTALARLGDAKAGEWFASRVRQSTGEDRVEAIRTLENLRLVKQAGVLDELLAGSDPGARAVAAEAAGALDYRAALPRLRELLTDAQPAVRMFAAIAVKRLGDPSADTQVSALLQSPIPQMRLMAAAAYQTSSTTEWVPLVRELLSEQNGMTRIRAAELLACCDKATARPALVAALDGRNPFERNEAMRILEDKRLADAPLIRRLLADDDAWVRVYAAGAGLAAAAPAAK
jgi:HEAT repeat protein